MPTLTAPSWPGVAVALTSAAFGRFEELPPSRRSASGGAPCRSSSSSAMAPGSGATTAAVAGKPATKPVISHDLAPRQEN